MCEYVLLPFHCGAFDWIYGSMRISASARCSHGTRHGRWITLQKIRCDSMAAIEGADSVIIQALQHMDTGCYTILIQKMIYVLHSSGSSVCAIHTLRAYSIVIHRAVWWCKKGDNLIEKNRSSFSVALIFLVISADGHAHHRTNHSTFCTNVENEH